MGEWNCKGKYFFVVEIWRIDERNWRKVKTNGHLIGGQRWYLRQYGNLNYRWYRETREKCAGANWALQTLDYLEEEGRTRIIEDFERLQDKV